MASITIEIPDELAERLRLYQSRIVEIIELGLYQLDANDVMYEETMKVLEILASSPSPQEVGDLKLSERLIGRARALLERDRTRGLNEWEQKEFERYERVDYLVTIAKAKAYRQLNVV